MASSRNLESRYEDQLIRGGYSYRRDISFRCDPPVKNRYGEWTKVVATIDFQIFNPEDEEEFCIHDVGGGNNSHKQAQRRVLWRAGVHGKFKLVRQCDIETLENAPDGIFPKLMARNVGW